MDSQLVGLLIGALVASVLHAAIPTHWLPFVLMGRVRGWGLSRILQITALAGACHVLLTILLGLGLASIGDFSKPHVGGAERLAKIASGALVAVGGIYIVLHFVRRGHHHHRFPIAAEHDHPHGSREHDRDHGHRLAEGATIGTLIAVMTFSPCEAVIPVFLPAAALGWGAVGLLSGVLLLGTVFGMLVLVALGHRGVELVKSEFLEHNERLILGLVIAILGAAGLVL